MFLKEDTAKAVGTILNKAASGALGENDYEALCRTVGVEKLYYDMDLGDPGRYRDQRTLELVVAGREIDNSIVLYDSGKKTGIRKMFPYFYDGREFVHAYIELNEEMTEDMMDMELYRFLADFVYIMASRENMRNMLDFAEMSDPQSGIPNVIFVSRKYDEMLHRGSGDRYAVIYFNLQNFKYINETAGSKCGDEVIIKYARSLMAFYEDDECFCRMGGDNFSGFVRKERLDDIIKTLKSVVISKLDSAPGRSFELSAWIGVSPGIPDDMRSFGVRLGEASMACGIGKIRLKQNVVFFSEELKMMMNRSREIMSMFMPAIKKREFTPFFQPKVNMETGELVGFEALCRWIHDGRFIFPDQFIPILDKEGLIHELDMAIFRETCCIIKKWKDSGLNPPRVSTNFSRKNLFVPDIEKLIYDTITESGIDVENVEIEITESVQEAETARLIEFVRKLKSYGIHISIDDFGTGYSSLMLIHNIDADVLKIDKSFVDAIPGDHKSEVLIESIINIAHNLDMSLIAEGVETAEQGRELLRLGCKNAQGYYYSKPVNFEEATGMMTNKPFRAINDAE
jgi:diguanylate cyclase (GGDEF)-like protein